MTRGEHREYRPIVERNRAVKEGARPSRARSRTVKKRARISEDDATARSEPGVIDLIELMWESGKTLRTSSVSLVVVN